MQIKTVLGSSIQAALAEARATLGDRVVLLESVAAENGQPARITVLLDPRPLAESALAEASEAPAEALAGAAGPGPRPLPEAPAPLPTGYAPRPPRPLFAPLGAPAPASAPPPAAPDPFAERFAALDTLAARLEHLAARLDAPSAGPSAEPSAVLDARLSRIESLLTSPLVGLAGPWHAHPVHGALRREGLAPGTVAALFAEVHAQGVALDRLDPDSLETVVWAAAQGLRARLASTAPARYTADTLVAVGAAGAGKTALLLRLATDPRFSGRRRTGVVVVAPDAPDALRADPAPLYAAHGLPVHTVHSEAELKGTLDALQGVDRLLVDTPPLPPSPSEADALLARLAETLAPLTASEVVLALDCSRAAPPLDLGRLDALALAPTLVALTHLDAAAEWGRAAEWLLGLGRPVGFASVGPSGPESLVPFAPVWFVEALMARLVA